MDQSSHAWLKTLETACERVLAEPSDRISASVREDIEKLLVRLRAQLNGGS